MSNAPFERGSHHNNNGRASDAEYDILKRFVRARDKNKCRNPRCSNRTRLHVHHIVFRSQGGPDTTGNLCVLCESCHDRVHGKVNGLLITIAGKRGSEYPDADVGLKFIYEGGK